MKKLLYILGSSLLKKMFLPQFGGNQSSASIFLPKINTSYLSEIARRYAIASATALVFSIFFVAGVVMALFSTAQSYDLFGVFVPSAVFFTGLGLALVSVVAVALCFKSIRNIKIVTENLYVLEEDSSRLRTPFDYLNLAQPFLHGVVNGWKKERAKKHYTRHPEEPFPADADLGRRESGNVADFRAS